MKMTEIVQLAPRDEYNDQFIYHFEHALSVGKIGAYDLKKNNNGDIYYGLFDNENLIAYLHLINLTVSMISVDRDYRGQGFATYLMDYAVLNDNLTITSDTRQTPDAKTLWLSLIRNNRYDISLSSTGELASQDDAKRIWNDKEDVYLIAKASVLTEQERNIINENEKRRKRAGRKEYWYGPGTSSELFWNP